MPQGHLRPCCRPSRIRPSSSLPAAAALGLCSLLWMLPAGHAANQPAVIVVTTGGATPLDEAATAELARGRHFKLLTVSALVPLAKQRDAANSVMARAGDLREHGRQALLALDHETAANKLAEALAILDKSLVRFYDPRFLADILVLRGIASLRMSRPELARESFAAAHQLDPKFKLDAHYSPQVRNAFEDAVGSAPTSAAPTSSQLAALVELAPHAQLAVVLATDHGTTDHLALQALLFDPQKRDYVGIESEDVTTADPVKQRAAARSLGGRLAATLDQRFAPPSTAALTALTENPPRQRPEIKPKPWYTRWYVWTAVGVVAGGLAIALPLALREEVVDMTVEWER